MNTAAGSGGALTAAVTVWSECWQGSIARVSVRNEEFQALPQTY